MHQLSEPKRQQLRDYRQRRHVCNESKCTVGIHRGDVTEYTDASRDKAEVSEAVKAAGFAFLLRRLSL